MIAHLRGTVSKLSLGVLSIDVAGVGYRVLVPLNTWEILEENSERFLWISTYVREDRLELFGFLEKEDRLLFEELIARPGIGPKLGLELCAVQGGLLGQAITEEDPRLLMSIRGIGKKTAEKLLIDLRTLQEKYPELFGAKERGTETKSALDQDAVAALTSLGYDVPTVLRTLRQLPKDLRTTEDRVTAALRSL